MGNPALDDLMSSGAPTCNFLEIDTVREGRILKFERTQQRDMDTGELKVWQDGQPMWQFVFTLATDDRDEEIEDDDGTRRLFAKAQMKDAVAKAIRKSGHKGDIEGGILKVKFVRQEKPTRKGWSGVKVFAAMYEPPAQTEAATEPDGDPDYGDEEPF